MKIIVLRATVEENLSNKIISFGNYFFSIHLSFT